MVLLDDHLLRDWLAGPDSALRRAIRRDSLATTNLFYARLCKSAASQQGGALLAGWAPDERGALIAALVALPEEFEVVPMRDVAWRMGQLIAEHGGLSACATLAGRCRCATRRWLDSPHRPIQRIARYRCTTDTDAPP